MKEQTQTILEARGLVVEYRTRRERVRALDDASISVAPAEVLGIVGESGSGKSTLGAALAGALPREARIESGEAHIEDHSVLHTGERELRALRRARLGFVFQDPIGTLDPTARVERQLRWALAAEHEGRASTAEIHALLEQVRLPDPTTAARAYPHQLSGGMAQRVSIAIALANRPAAVIADEPTASLDASIQAEILELLVDQARHHSTAVVLMSHDLPAVRRFCDRVAVMYGGRVVEQGPPAVLFANPAHPYTRELLASALGHEQPGQRVEPIPGQPPVLRSATQGCGFAPRCRSVLAECLTVRPELHHVGEAQTLCHLPVVASAHQEETSRG
ncbi:ABC transporter ATP-binding protein [Sciscionella marina]|uniref:ABC transporter ATP-binding protein n=1 Tax=Sciscionella marina TaxID=508770 RepID=UPI000372552C|nr:ABC transporter ATP-binding protein [Sciscionella marina]